jgi:hypothetical protein
VAGCAQHTATGICSHGVQHAALHLSSWLLTSPAFALPSNNNAPPPHHTSTPHSENQLSRPFKLFEPILHAAVLTLSRLLSHTIFPNCGHPLAKNAECLPLHASQKITRAPQC